MESFGKRIKHARRVQGWSQQELARRCNISRNWLSNIECDVARNVSLDVKQRLALELNMPLPGNVSDRVALSDRLAKLEALLQSLNAEMQRANESLNVVKAELAQGDRLREAEAPQ